MAGGFPQRAERMEEGERLSALFELMMEPCIELRKTRHEDDEGGYWYTYDEGVRFDAAIVKDKTLAAKVAEKEGVTAVYTVTTKKEMELEFHEVFRRLSDGAVFRVTGSSEDGKTPPMASFQFAQTSAERWTLPA